MIKTNKNSRTHQSAINADEMSLLISDIMERCDSIESKLDILIAKQAAKLCQCDSEDHFIIGDGSKQPYIE